MLKFIFVLLGVAAVAFLALRDTWMITVSAFGFEFTTSIVILIMALVLLLYILHLLKKPFRWFHRYQAWYQKRKQSQKEAFLIQALKTVLDRDSVSVKSLLKQKNNFFDKKSNENYMIEALFDPSTHVFEQLLHRPETELAGVRGLLDYAKKSGDLTGASRLIQTALENHPNETWVLDAEWTLQTLQNDWDEALKTLEKLKKTGQVAPDEYRHKKACLLLKLDQVKEAYKLAPNNPEIILAYIKMNPKKATDIVMDSWKTNPSWITYLAFREAIRTEKPAKQIKLTQKLVQKATENRLTHMVMARAYLDNEQYPLAKEELTTYLNEYPLIAPVAQMMAEAERAGWHHEEVAKSWEQKALSAPEFSGWGCAECGHKTAEWDALCPDCNAFGTIKYK